MSYSTTLTPPLGTDPSRSPKLFEGVRFCSECAIELRSCYLGRSKYLANRLALKTGCSVKLHEGLVNPYGEPVEE